MEMPWSEWQVTDAMTPEYISPTLGLLDGSGAGIVEWLETIGVTAWSNPDASFAEVAAAAGHQPMVIGGRAWGHWVAVRTGVPFDQGGDVWTLALMNPAPGYAGVDQFLLFEQFQELGPFSAVWMAIP